MKKLIIPTLILILITSCSSTENSVKNEASIETDLISKNEVSLKNNISLNKKECENGIPLWVECWWWLVVWKHIIINDSKDIIKPINENWEYAIKFCDKLEQKWYSDWYLPSIDEAFEISDNILEWKISSKVNLKNGSYYWSSTKNTDKNYANSNDFAKAWLPADWKYNDTLSENWKKTEELLVRCIRNY